MSSLFNVDWQKVFVSGTSPVEIFVRGTVVYLTLFLLLRVVLKREAGTLGITDLLVVVLLADAAQNAMAGEYTSITDGLILVGTIIFWAYALNWLGYHSRLLGSVVHPPPLPLIKEGRVLRRNLRLELITEEELSGMLRLEGVEDVSQVKEARMETDGRISVIKKEGESEHARKNRAAG